ncbi:bifunctional DNA-formamidopyrimidine glycosylase/DNA-(apurinic or apyrimidinic site) lyase [Aliiglaciecola sp. CAU 1673]|uniref:bifunctional DNA-formamidopyrimidine glycosylase/DNA-(apurinic or apyrimidinic site) lyase n=1 Tax=Aliiglaciecola sp. CAU 1673 TaxID=3032595 RepID=UPI0023DC0E63|nr:bifunctional DNA-formamidopyrimidine glycosylase/DNA-(apurinic or apyrimidinic site) lyase [Aliiglaciecola sp. CAU 1673]MDF2179283.1 bifunctional DNA-formamidopyrimidine glycosylase/DNA-(apurinic or apyrimidinic site) lyase [Aliiglaciecola sp. CAU 1673]
MPELPEVEVSRLGISPHLTNRTLKNIIVRQRQLRWPIPEEVYQAEGQVINSVRRRAKYLLIDTAPGSLILHLGMSGSLRVVPANTPLNKHDHLDLVLDNGQCLRFNDPRRFGACLWQAAGEPQLEMLTRLGPEPLSEAFDADRLYTLSRKRQQAVKNFIMDNQVVVGVGNIYASESLFMAGIDPRKAAGRVGRQAYERLADCIREVLAQAITQGGTTLKDFTQVDGNPGYFAQQLRVYGRTGKPCLVCEEPVKSITLGQRNSFYCPRCQR